jgi:hypothetical protein
VVAPELPALPVPAVPDAAPAPLVVPEAPLVVPVLLPALAPDEPAPAVDEPLEIVPPELPQPRREAAAIVSAATAWVE